MKIQLMTLEELEERAKKPFEELAALISVSYGDENWQSFDYKPQYTLDVNIDGVPMDDNDNPVGIAAITPDQVEEIAAFVKQHLDEVDALICQSFPYDDNALAIVIAAAVEDFLMHDNGDIFLGNGCGGGYYDAYIMLKDALAGKHVRFAAIIEDGDDDGCMVKVDEVDIDE